ncbi:DUF4041 domain-containing protein [Pseudoclavibacter sp. VKM Ac-2888]|uniref:DUF4041 domain-containing protein n=1 Tax=Pseudoclavibacter sp. VKM Ac-2888 TaxID=2783830 RepID=UPI00188DC241|nr:DUF4041 domain-containing protein [Pseudoclavibacter sp. VKM Ac-2888]MBF4550907.1 DUF4041 domain-containing protein [Pseudoclavibacter sp. VKM Ac-2888]
MSMNETSFPAGWYPDPIQQFEHRYWDGARWTEHVQRGGQQTTSALHGPAADTPRVVSQLADAKIPVLGTRRHAELLREEIKRLAGLVEHHGLLEVEERAAAVGALLAEEEQVRSRIRGAQNELAQRQHEASALNTSLLDLRGAVEIQENGLYDFEHPAEDSIVLASRLEAVRSRIKTTVRDGGATQASTNFTFNNSEAQGRKFVRDMSKLMLRSYNAEAENCVKAVRAGNLHTAQSRLSKAVEQIERLGTMISLRISPHFHALRLEELELANRHLRALQAEKEAERAHKEELREQRKAEKELQAEKARLEKERSHYANTIAALDAKGDFAGAERMRARLDDVVHAIENVDYRAANIRAGYVYVISNVGSFGPEVVKIGLTRRLEPMDRVHELGDASVPFRFDVHALFFADDAVTIEAQLHRHFADRRINKVNFRREYFRATPTEVRDALQEQRVELLDFRLDPQAEEFNASRALEASA